MPAFGRTAFGQNRIWPKKSEFGQFWCLMFGKNFLVVVVVPGCCLLVPVGACWCLLLPVGACWCLLVPVGACWCLLVPVGACWCLLVPGGACWWCLLVVPVGGACWWCLLVVVVGGCCLCMCGGVQDLASPPDPLRRTALPWTAQNFALFFPSPATIFFLLSGGLLVEFWWCF